MKDKVRGKERLREMINHRSFISKFVLKMATVTRLGQAEAWSLSCFSCVSAGTCALGPLSTDFRGNYQGAEPEIEQAGLKWVSL